MDPATSCFAPRTAPSRPARCIPGLLWQVASLDLTPEEAIDLVLGAPRLDAALAPLRAFETGDGEIGVELGDAAGGVRERRSFDAQGRLRGVERLAEDGRRRLVGSLRRLPARVAACPSRTRSASRPAQPATARGARALGRRAESRAAGRYLPAAAGRAGGPARMARGGSVARFAAAALVCSLLAACTNNPYPGRRRRASRSSTGRSASRPRRSTRR